MLVTILLRINIIVSIHLLHIAYTLVDQHARSHTQTHNITHLQQLFLLLLSVAVHSLDVRRRDLAAATDPRESGIVLAVAVQIADIGGREVGVSTAA